MRGFDALNRLGLATHALRNRPGGRILIYHGLDRRGGSGFNTRFMGVDEFERQIEWMSSHFRIVTLDEYLRGVRDPIRFTVALTFDDGYATWVDLASPVLERHKAPAAFFVTAIRAAGEHALRPDRLDIAMHLHRAPVRVRGEEFEWRPRQREYVSASHGLTLKNRCKQADWAFIQDALAAFPAEITNSLPEDLAPYWRMLDESGLRHLASSPMATIGSHGVRHLTLPRQTRDVARAEMADSKRWIEGVIGKDIRALAFPDGAWNAQTLMDGAALGYSQLLGTDVPEDAHPPHSLPSGRLGMNPFISWANQVRCIYSGRYL